MEEKTIKIEGITLIALVITIIILLILAGVSIAMLTGENGIITQAQKAKEETLNSSEREAIQLTMINKELTNEEKYNIGEELKDRTLANGDNWKIISVNDTKQIYGTDWYYVETGVNLENYGETKYEWVINYNTGEVIELPEKGFVKLSYGENLAVRDEIILNADPINMSDENSWGEGVTVYGIQEEDGYGWNETEFKLDGVDDYIEVYPQENVNMKNGLTFEFYGKTDINKVDEEIQMLCKTEKGNTDKSEYSNKFRTLWTEYNFRCCMSIFNSQSDWALYENGGTQKHWIGKDDIGTFANEQGGYVTMTVDFDSNIIALYWNGEFVGSTVCSHEWLIGGDIDNPEIPFTIGLQCGGNVYTEDYSKVDIYACRLYNKILTADEVKANYDKTVAYHNVLVQGEK